MHVVKVVMHLMQILHHSLQIVRSWAQFQLFEMADELVKVLDVLLIDVGHNSTPFFPHFRENQEGNLEKFHDRDLSPYTSLR